MIRNVHIRLLLTVLGLALLSACSKSCKDAAKEEVPPSGMAGSHHTTMTPEERALADAQKQRKVLKGEVIEAIYKEGFAYILLKTDAETTWVAVVKQKPAVGDKVAVQEQAVLKDFHSKSLDRTFDKIIFGALID
jgi:hypothetical protein